jgi:DNA primase
VSQILGNGCSEGKFREPAVNQKTKDSVPLVTRVRHRDCLDSWQKTAGGKGLHLMSRWPHQSRRRAPVLQPAGATPGSDSSRSLHDLVRAGKAQQAYYIDYLRNGRGMTPIGAYFPRARDGFPVAAPVTWAQMTSRSAHWQICPQPAHLSLRTPLNLAFFFCAMN